MTAAPTDNPIRQPSGRCRDRQMVPYGFALKRLLVLTLVVLPLIGGCSTIGKALGATAQGFAAGAQAQQQRTKSQQQMTKPLQQRTKCVCGWAFFWRDGTEMAGGRIWHRHKCGSCGRVTLSQSMILP